MTVEVGAVEQADGGATTLERAVPAPISGLAVLVLVLVAALLLRAVSEIAVQLLCGGFLAVVAWPMYSVMLRARIPSAVALVLTTLVMLSVVIAGGAIIAVSVGELVGLVAVYESRLQELIGSLWTLLAQLGVTTDPDALLAVVSPEQVTTQAQALASSVSGAGVAVVVSALVMIFGLAGAPALQAQAVRYLGIHHPIVEGVTGFGGEARRYLLVRAQLGLFAAVLSFVLLLVIGIPLPALWAALVFATSFIPNLGVLLALIPPTLLALLDIGVGGAVAVVVGYGVINFVQDNLLQPIAFGAELNMTPLVGFVGVIAWTWILGAAGAILAIPLTLAIVEILGAFPSTRALSAMMRNETSNGARPSPDSAAAAAVE